MSSSTKQYALVPALQRTGVSWSYSDGRCLVEGHGVWDQLAWLIGLDVSLWLVDFPWSTVDMWPLHG